MKPLKDEEGSQHAVRNWWQEKWVCIEVVDDIHVPDDSPCPQD